MAIVRDLSGNFPASLPPSGTDVPFSSINRTHVGPPRGVLVPLYVGEVVHDTANSLLYIATGLTNIDWVMGSIHG